VHFKLANVANCGLYTTC